MDRIHESFVCKSAENLSKLDFGDYAVMAIRSVTTKFGPTYILLIGEDLNAYWANPYVKKILDLVLTDEKKATLQDPVLKYITKEDTPVAEIKVSEVNYKAYNRNITKFHRIRLC